MAGIRVQYGAYTHDEGECEVSISRTEIPSQQGVRVGTKHSWSISGRLIAANQTLLSAAIVALEAAYVDGSDLVLEFDDDSNTAHTLTNASCYGGTRVVSGVSYLESDAEYITSRRYQVTVEGEVHDGASEELSFSETISLSGGGPRDEWIESPTGRPVKQRLNDYTLYRAVQRGQRVGKTYWINPPAPKWPASYHYNENDVEDGPPEKLRGDAYAYPTTWTYRFESGLPLTGKPSV